MDVDPRPDIEAMDVEWAVVPRVVKLVAGVLGGFLVVFWLAVVLGSL